MIAVTRRPSVPCLLGSWRFRCARAFDPLMSSFVITCSSNSSNAPSSSSSSSKRSWGSCNWAGTETAVMTSRCRLLVRLFSVPFSLSVVSFCFCLGQYAPSTVSSPSCLYPCACLSLSPGLLLLSRRHLSFASIPSQLYVCLSCLSLCLSDCPFSSLSSCLSLCLSDCLFSSLSTCLSLCLSDCPLSFLSSCLSLCPSLSLIVSSHPSMRLAALCFFVCLHRRICLNTSPYIYIYVYIHNMYIYIHKYMYIYIYMYICTYSLCYSPLSISVCL